MVTIPRRESSRYISTAVHRHWGGQLFWYLPYQLDITSLSRNFVYSVQTFRGFCQVHFTILLQIQHANNTDKPKFVAILVFVCITATFIKQISSFENVPKRDAILTPVAKQWIGTLRSGRRRQRKRRLKSEFAFFQSWLRLLQVTYFVKCRRTLLKWNS